MVCLLHHNRIATCKLMPVIGYIPHIWGTTGRIAWWMKHRKDAVRRLSSISGVTGVVRTCSFVIEMFLLK